MNNLDKINIAKAVVKLGFTGNEIEKFVEFFDNELEYYDISNIDMDLKMFYANSKQKGFSTMSMECDVKKRIIESIIEILRSEVEKIEDEIEKL